MTDLIHKLRDSTARHDAEANRLCYTAADEIESLRAKLAECEKQRDEKDRQVASLYQKWGECEKDAARYRYLRSLWKHDHFSMETQPNGNPDSCDAAIDAAMSLSNDNLKEST